MVAVPPPPTSPERRLPLRQLPSERSFSASPRNVDPVRNDWVLPLLNSVSAYLCGPLRISALSKAFNAEIAEVRREPQRETKIVTSTVTNSVFLSQKPAY